MTTAVIAASILAAAGAVHGYWAAGGRIGFDAAVPQMAGKRRFTPGKAMTLVVAVGLFALAALVLWRDGLIAVPLPFEIARYGVPLMVFEGEPFFGQDRFDQLKWRMTQKGLQPRR